MLAHEGRGEHHPSLGGERLRQGRGDDDVLGALLAGAGQPGPGEQAGTPGTDDPEGVGLVEDEQDPRLRREGHEVRHRGGVAEHGVDRLRDDHRPGALAA